MPSNLSPAAVARAAWRDACAEGVDREALRFQAFCADRLVQVLPPAAGERVLDVETGSGALALAAAQAVGPGGRVTAIDVSERLLARLEAKIAQFGIANIDLHAMDGARLDFRRDYFQELYCALGLHVFPDAGAALREWRRVLRPGGRVGIASFAASAFQPYAGLLQTRLGGVALPWEALAQEGRLEALLGAAGFEDIELRREPIGYHLPDANGWWEVVAASGLRALLAPLTPAQIEALRAAHLAEVAAAAGADGPWLDCTVWVALGRKPI
jgi:SAM-dependent methyltransferase